MLLVPLGEDQYYISCWQPLLKLEDLIWYYFTAVRFQNRRRSLLEGLIEVLLSSILECYLNVVGFTHNPLVWTGIFYITAKSHMINRSKAAKWSMVVQLPNLKVIQYTGY